MKRFNKSPLACMKNYLMRLPWIAWFRLPSFRMGSGYVDEGGIFDLHLFRPISKKVLTEAKSKLLLKLFP